jgi:hypothetical protein
MTEEQVTDALPEELDVTAYVGPYLFPDIKRRRIAGAINGGIGVVGVGTGLASDNNGLLIGGIVLLAIALYHYLAGWHLAVDQTEALAAASRAAGFPVGHASAQLAWRGLRSRPSWRVLVYSDDSPPTMRGLVEVDGVDAHILGEYTEDNPEDWSEYGLPVDEAR